MAKKQLPFKLGDYPKSVTQSYQPKTYEEHLKRLREFNHSDTAEALEDLLREAWITAVHRG